MAIVGRRNPDTYFGRMTLLKKLFWVYFLLLIFEGALRKWAVPALSAPLLIVRDPVSLLIIWEAFRTNKWPSRWSAVISLVTVLLVGLFVVQIIGGDSLIVGLYGLRSYLLPIPVLFIIGENLDYEDLRKLCVCTLWLLLPMSLLEVAQYLAPSGGWLNKGATEGGGQIGFVVGHVRASGTFSFSIGAEFFVSMAAAFILYGMVSTGFANKWLLWATVFAVILSVPTLGSRAVLVQLAAMLACVAIGATMGLSQFGKVLRVILPLAIFSFLAAQLPVFSDAMQSLTERVAGANNNEGGGVEEALVFRTVGPIVDAIEGAVSSNNWLGRGMGSDAGVFYALGNSEWSDNEIDREMMELGPIAGIGSFLIKSFLAITLLSQALARARNQQGLALFMLPPALSLLFFGTPEQPTTQGFMVVTTAFCIAAASAPAPVAAEMPQLVLLRQQMLQRRRLQRS